MWNRGFRRFYNTVRLTKGQRRQKRKHFERKEKEKAAWEASKEYRHEGSRMSAIYQEAKENMQEFLFEIKSTHKFLHEATTEYISRIEARNDMFTATHDVSSLRTRLRELRISQREDTMLKMISTSDKIDPVSEAVIQSSLEDLVYNASAPVKEYNNFVKQFIEDLDSSELNVEERNGALNRVLKSFSGALNRAIGSEANLLETRMVDFVVENKDFGEETRLSRKEAVENHKGTRILRAQYPDTLAMNILLQSFCSRRKFHDAIKLYEEFANNFNVVNDTSTYVTLIECYSMTNKVNRALKLFNDGIELANEFEYVDVKQEIQFVNYLFDYAQLHKVAIQAASTSVFHALSGKDIFDDMIVRGFIPDSETYVHLIECFAILGDVANAVEVFESLPLESKTMQMYAAVFKAIERSQKQTRRRMQSILRDYDILGDLETLMASTEMELKNEDQALSVAENLVEDNQIRLPFGGHVDDALVPHEYKSEEELDPFRRLLESADSTNYVEVLEHRMAELGVNMSRGRMDILSLQKKDEVTERNLTLIDKYREELKQQKVQNDKQARRILVILARTYSFLDSDERILKLVNEVPISFPVAGAMYGMLAKHYLRKGNVSDAVLTCNKALSFLSLKTLNYKDVGLFAECYARQATEEGFDQCFTLIDKYLATGAAKFLSELHYEPIRYFYKRSGFQNDLYDKVIPASPNAWKSPKTISTHLKNAKVNRNTMKQAQVLLSQTQKEK